MQVLNEQKKGVDAYLRTPPVYISRKWVLFKGKEYRCFDKVVTREYCFSSLSLSLHLIKSIVDFSTLSAWGIMFIRLEKTHHRSRLSTGTESNEKRIRFFLSLSLVRWSYLFSYWFVLFNHLFRFLSFSLPIVYSSNR